MYNIVEVLERQKIGLGRYNKTEIAFKDLYGLTDDNVEDLDNCPLFAARFCPLLSYKDVIAVAAEDGNIIVRNCLYPLTSPKAIGTYHLLRAHNNAVFDLTWAEGETRLVTASGDHSAALWDLSGPCLQQVMTFIGHTRSVRTVATSPSHSSIFATGSRDGSVMLWDCRGPSQSARLYPDNTISHCHAPNLVSQTKSKGVESITSVVFTDENSLATCVAGQGTICIWDIRRTYRGTRRRPFPKHMLHHPTGQSVKGYSCLTVSPCRLRLYASCIDANIYCFNIGTYSEKPIFEYRGHTASSFYVKHSVSPCGRYLISGSGDSKAYIWREGDSSPAAVLSGHMGEVTSAVWAPYNPFQVATASEDGSYKIWSVNPLVARDEPPPTSTCLHLPSTNQLIKPKISCRFNCKKDTTSKPTITNRASPIKSPVKPMKKRPRLECSPSKSDFSPTADLPNYVFDGVSPNILTRSGKKKPREDDWLTKLRKETPPGAKKSNTPKRTPRTSKAKGSLLQFFCSQQPRRGKTNGATLNGDLGTQNLEATTTSICCENAIQGP